MKTVIITGASGNLGFAVTNKFLEAGYYVVATILKNTDMSRMPQSPFLQIIEVDLTDANATEIFVKTCLEKQGRVDALVMLVGAFGMGDALSTTIHDISTMMTLNFNTAYNVSRPVYTHMHTNGYGRLVFIGARPALDAESGKSMLAYALSKSLLFKLADFYNADAKGKNVVSTVIVPSTIDTPVNREAMPDADPSNWVKPAQLAEIISFVCSEAADTIREPVIKVYNNA